jgi:hypothetical protein
VGEPLTPDSAYALQAEIIQQRAGQMSTWVPLAAALHRFHESQAWTLLACQSFNEWLGQPEVWISRAEAYGLIQAWRELVEARDVEPADLARLDPSKVQVVLPAIRAGAAVEDALADCAALSRADLRAKYQTGDDAQYTTCPQCGSRVKVAA